jgi:hypothetical protein
MTSTFRLYRRLGFVYATTFEQKRTRRPLFLTRNSLKTFNQLRDNDEEIAMRFVLFILLFGFMLSSIKNLLSPLRTDR